MTIFHFFSSNREEGHDCSKYCVLREIFANVNGVHAGFECYQE